MVRENEENEEEVKNIRINKNFNLFINVICIFISIIFLFNAVFGFLHGMGVRSFLLMFVMFLAFLIYPMGKKDSKWRIATDICLSIFGFIAFFRVFVTEDSLLERGGQPEFIDLILGGIGILLILEGIRRTIGWILPVIIIIFIMYGFLGPYFPDLFAHAGFSYTRFIQVLYLTTEGIFSSPIAAVANFVIIYIILGSILQKNGTGKTFIDLSLAILGRFRGGPGKVAVISSSLLGTVSGSTVSNVMASGPITIPLMKNSRFNSTTAGAIESVSSTGGQLMPPVMGAAAFIMAEMTGISYINIVFAAIIPAILYYVSLFYIVDFEAAKKGIKGLYKRDLPNIIQVLKNEGHLLLPIITLIVSLGVFNFSPQYSAFWSIITAIIVPQIRKNTRLSFKSYFDALKDGAVNVIIVTVVCAGAGIIMGIILYSGIGLTLSSILITLAAENIILLLILTAGASLILGMGLPTGAAYILLAVLVAPALIDMDLSEMAAHLFVFYFGILSAITPPVAVAAYASSSLSGANPMSTGFRSFKFGFAGFIIPFLFVFNPELLMQGTWVSIIWVLFKSIIAVYAVASFQQNYLINKLSYLERGLLFTSVVLIVIPNIGTELIGLSIIVITMLQQYMKNKKKMDMPLN